MAAINAKDFAAAKAKLLELKTSWDDGTMTLRKKDKATWKVIDKEMYLAFDAVNEPPPDATKASVKIQSFIDKLKLAQ